MDKYYYFVSQLPFLTFGQESYIDRERFLDEAKKWLSDKDFSMISGVSLNDFYPRDGDSEVLVKYKNFEEALRKEIASFRKNESRGGLTSLNLNLNQGTPLEIEKTLLGLRWKFIESLEQGHFFDLEILILHFLKIGVLERLLTFDKEKGTAVLDKLCEVCPVRSIGVEEKRTKVLTGQG